MQQGGRGLGTLPRDLISFCWIGKDFVRQADDLDQRGGSFPVVYGGTEAVGAFFAHFDVYANVEEALADFDAVHALAHRARADRRVRRRGSGAQS